MSNQTSSNDSRERLSKRLIELQLLLQSQELNNEEQLSKIRQIICEELYSEFSNMKKREESILQAYDDKVRSLEQQVKAEFDLKLQQIKQGEKKSIESKGVQIESPILQSRVMEEESQSVSLKQELQRQMEIEGLRKELDDIKKSLVTDEEIDFITERKAYEVTIVKLNSEIKQLQNYIQQLNEEKNISVDLINFNNQLHEDNLLLQSSKSSLQIKVTQLNQVIDEQRDIIEGLCREKETLQNLLGQARREVDPSQQYKSPLPVRREYNFYMGSLDRESRYKYYPRSFQQYQSYPRTFPQSGQKLRDLQDVQESIAQEQNRQNAEDQNELDINQRVKELDDLQNKYKNALINIQQIEARVIQRLQRDEIVFQ